MTEGFLNQGGGGFSALPMMTGNPAILLNNVAAFTLNVTATIWAGGYGFFGDRNTSSFGFSSLEVFPYLEVGEPAVISAPEPAAGLVLALGLLVAGPLSARRPKI